jgi:hypothetical protein
MISFKVPPERLEEVENAYLTSLVPAMETYRGFTFALVFRNQDTNANVRSEHLGGRRSLA